MNKKSTFKDVANNYLRHTKEQNGITLIALVITIIVHLISYDKKVECSI